VNKTTDNQSNSTSQEDMDAEKTNSTDKSNDTNPLARQSVVVKETNLAHQSEKTNLLSTNESKANDTCNQIKPKSVPVYKWGLKFNGEGSVSVAAFLERAEELRRARGVSCQELYESAVDLFSGTALMWYRSACRRISSWEQLKEELKHVFQSADYDDRLHQEILHRTQGDTESLDLYLAAMDGLFGRLSVPLSEEIKLERILKNMNTYLQDKLCMFNINTRDELQQLGRKAEVGKLRSSTLQPPPKPTGVMEPDLACYSGRRKIVQGTVSYLQNNQKTPPPARKSIMKCWNCGEENHAFRDCRKEKKIFCYGCGQPGVRKSSCPKCGSKNGQPRGTP